MIDLLEISLNELPEEGAQLTDEIHPNVFELKPEEGKATTGLKYDLYVQQFETELLLRGSLSAVFELECVRTLHPFTLTIQVPDFTHSLEVTDDVINPTEQLREEIMILFPTYPVCDMGDEGGTCEIEEKYLALDNDPESDLEDQPASGQEDRWASLDQLENLD